MSLLAVLRADAEKIGLEIPTAAELHAIVGALVKRLEDVITGEVEDLYPEHARPDAPADTGPSTATVQAQPDGSPLATPASPPDPPADGTVATAPPADVPVDTPPVTPPATPMSDAVQGTITGNAPTPSAAPRADDLATVEAENADLHNQLDAANAELAAMRASFVPGPPAVTVSDQLPADMPHADAIESAPGVPAPATNTGTGA